MKELINALNEYLDEKDSKMLHINPLKMSEERGEEPSYYRGFRSGACEVIGEINGIVNAFDNEE